MNKNLVQVSIATLIIFSIFLIVQTIHISNTAATTNTVSFSGEGKISAKPDIAVISASILTQATDSKTAQDENSRKSKNVSDFLKKQGIEEKDIKTSGYNISPQCKYPPYGGQPAISGYQVMESYEIKLRDLAKVSVVLDGLVSAGANQVNNLGLQIENPDELMAQARQLAIDNARKKAEALEDQIDIKLGRVVNFSENAGGYPMPMYAYGMKGEGMGGGGGPDVSLGQNDVVVNITITYQIR